MMKNEFERTINASDLQEWIMEAFPDWCEGDVRLIYDHIDDMPAAQHNVQDSVKDADCISRQQAIDALGEEPPVWTGSDYELGQRNQYDLDRLHLELVPSAQPKTGKWEIYVISMFDGEGCRCSECGFEGAPYWNFCPNCGARMEGD